MVVAFPLFKLVALFVGHVSRPIANQLKNGAKRSHAFRRYVCLPIAQRDSMVVAFPLFKLVALFVRQVSRPIANQLKNGAKRSHAFRRYVCLPIAQLYHRVDVTKKMLMMGFGKPAKVPSLTEESAVELGADILGEVIVYSIAATLFTLEYMRTSEKARVKEELLLNRISNLEDKISELALSAERNEAVLRSMERLVKEKSSSLSWWKGGKPSSASENDQKEGGTEK
ncbi:hypothetical protein M514_10145 [Trichuris suis]|uniref:Optic atrophy 3 protein n=1 Tax=Trichuris suis TaxID=68888 RepID=A0A085N0D6_9BILA|nr:hypothetical protein M514_10145 [Trichuris suis]